MKPLEDIFNLCPIKKKERERKREGGRWNGPTGNSWTIPDFVASDVASGNWHSFNLVLRSSFSNLIKTWRPFLLLLFPGDLLWDIRGLNLTPVLLDLLQWSHWEFGLPPLFLFEMFTTSIFLGFFHNLFNRNHIFISVFSLFHTGILAILKRTSVGLINYFASTQHSAFFFVFSIGGC